MGDGPKGETAEPRDGSIAAPSDAASARRPRRTAKSPADPVASVLDDQIGTIRRLLESYAAGATDEPDVQHEAMAALNTAIDKIYDIQQEHRRNLPRVAGAEEVGYQAIVAWQLKRLRLASSTTQAELADAMNRLGFSWGRVTVAEVEAGSRRASLEELVGLSALYATPLIEFLLPMPRHYLRMPDGRAIEPTVLLALATGIGTDRDLPESLWSPALQVAEVRPTEEDWRPAVNLSPGYPYHRAQIVQAAIDERQRTIEWMEARLAAEESSSPKQAEAGDVPDAP